MPPFGRLRERPSTGSGNLAWPGRPPGEQPVSYTHLDVYKRQARTRTIGSILRSMTTAVIATIAVLTILDALGVPLGPIVASAGIGGVALGFGAQSLVKDFLSGLFMIMEDQFGVGDLIDPGDVTGTVEDVGLRTKRLRDASGEVWDVLNGEIARIGNRSQGWSTATEMCIRDSPVDRPRLRHQLGRPRGLRAEPGVQRVGQVGHVRRPRHGRPRAGPRRHLSLIHI